MASGPKTRTLTIGGQSVFFNVAAATTSTPPATASQTALQAKLGMDKKETWLSNKYKEARAKSASAQFGSKGQKQHAAPNPVDESDRKPAALETASVTQTVLSASTGTNALDALIPQKPGKEESTKVKGCRRSYL